MHDATQQPIWQGTNLTTQDSYSYLKAVLGLRANDGAYHLADANSVDPSAGQVRPLSPNVQSIRFGTPISGTITSSGDYVVYRFDAPANESVLIYLTPT